MRTAGFSEKDQRQDSQTGIFGLNSIYPTTLRLNRREEKGLAVSSTTGSPSRKPAFPEVAQSPRLARPAAGIKGPSYLATPLNNIIATARPQGVGADCPPLNELAVQMPTKVLCLILLVTTSFTTLAFDIQDDLLIEVAAEYDNDAQARLERWQEPYVSARGQPVEQQLEQVDQFFNQVPFSSDLDNWDVEDYWATPVELFARFAADCEDYSIAKYLTLRVDEDRLRITYVKTKELNQAHMVLTYYPTLQSDPLVLDNLINDINRATDRTDLEPVYSFNGISLWLTKLKRADERRIGGRAAFNTGSSLIDALSTASVRAWSRLR